MFGMEMYFDIWSLHSFDSAVFPDQGLLVEAVSLRQSFIEQHMVGIEFDAQVYP